VTGWWKSMTSPAASSREAMRVWMESRIASGLEIPEPSIADDYSGRILLRMPKYVHRRLAVQAQQEGSSLNQYILSLLSYGCAQIRSSPLQMVSPAYQLVPGNHDLVSNACMVLYGNVAASKFQSGKPNERDEVLAGFSGPSSQFYGVSPGRVT
jgi:hypothetical protein